MRRLLFGLAVALVSFAQATNEAAGLAALDRHDYAAAEATFSQLAQADPNDYSALFNLALAETGLSKDDAAAGHFARVLQLKPKLFQAEMNLGLLYLRDGRAADALPLLTEASQTKPGNATLDRKIGEALLALNRLDEAEAQLRKAGPKESLLPLAPAYEKAGRNADAERILKESPDDPGAQEELGRLALTANRPADAVTFFARAVQLSPTMPNKVALASAYLKNNQADLAAPLLEEALRENENDYQLHMVVGRLYRDRRNFPPAAAQFRRAAELRPDDAEPLRESSSVLVLMEQYGPALADLDKIHALGQDTPGSLYYRALIFDKLRKPKLAYPAYQQFLNASAGKFPDQEFVARQRVRILEKEAKR